MKSNKNFQKSKKPRPFDDDETRVKRADSSSKKIKNFKKEIYDEIDEFEEIDLFGKNEDYDDEEEKYLDDEDEEEYLDDDEDSDY